MSPSVLTEPMETIRVDDDGGVRIITMNRPEALNAINSAMIDELTDAYQAAAEDQSIKVVVLTGEGRAFSAGADLKAMGGPPKQSRHELVDMLHAIIDLPQPLIAAVNGLGAGYGATICGLADMTVMAEDARIKAPFSALGLTAELASTYNFPRLMGPQKAMWFLLSSDWMSASECFDVGLALEVCASDLLDQRVMARASHLATMPRASLVMTKRLMVDAHRDAMKEAVAREGEGLNQLGGGPANVEAIAAFKDRRDPDFTGM